MHGHHTSYSIREQSRRPPTCFTTAPLSRSPPLANLAAPRDPWRRPHPTPPHLSPHPRCPSLKLRYDGRSSHPPLPHHNEHAWRRRPGGVGGAGGGGPRAAGRRRGPPLGGRRGRQPRRHTAAPRPPPTARRCPPYSGLECSGTILAFGPNAPPQWAIGDKVCTLLSGGYAEKVVVPAGQMLPVPEGVSLADTAGLPEVACTIWSTIFMTSHLSLGESFLVRSIFYFQENWRTQLAR
uniref:Alcohol dehydrogenase-like N-terminal domain-containing protein n=1 Tax=Zea mays TaxID=4577 RepID=A0A804QLS9_MAIZE